MTTNTIATQTVRYYNTRGSVISTETITGDAVDADYRDVKPVAEHGLNRSAMKALVNSDDAVDRMLVAEQPNIASDEVRTLAMDSDLTTVLMLGANPAVCTDDYISAVGKHRALLHRVDALLVSLDALDGAEVEDRTEAALLDEHLLVRNLVLAGLKWTASEMLLEMVCGAENSLVRAFAADSLEKRGIGIVYAHVFEGCSNDDARVA